MGFDFSGSASLRLLFESIGVYWSEKGDDASLFGVISSYARDPRAFPGLLHFLLSQPSQHPSLGEINGGWKNVIWMGWKYRKICPKFARYLLINRWLHENRWRLWKQKVQNRCSVRARARARGMLESLFNSGWFHSLGEVSWRCCNFLRRV